MQIVIHVPDDFVEPVKEKLAGGPTGVLEAVTLDAILQYLDALANPGKRSSSRWDTAS
jgi:hypothetical protein